ncbi:uncharacterized protein LOC123194457 isoform X3 [Mangifera indica]|uniref:uncharacterized protein LOC123194457 isoform X3 n=1 Tax=Mangifera indica TaxID=29780 RepID=UPI001CF98A3A|nr:uncharacterized protein LOC123194457 isoform X3 [Mangifera indica]
MSPTLSSQGVFLATAMAAVSGTVILLALRRQKSSPTTQFSIDHIPHDSSQEQVLRSCISSEGKKREKKKKKKKKKRVQFAEDVVDPKGNGQEFRKQHRVLREASSAEDVVDPKGNGQEFRKQHRVLREASSSSSSSSSTSSSSSCQSEFKKTGEMPANRMALYHGKLRDRGFQRLRYAY